MFQSGDCNKAAEEKPELCIIEKIYFVQCYFISFGDNFTTKPKHFEPFYAF